MFDRLKRIFNIGKEPIPKYINPKSKIFKSDNGWVEIKPFYRKNHIVFVLYNFKAKSENERAEYNRFYIELESPDEIRDFLEWLDGSVSSLLYNSTRAYIEVDFESNHFIQITNYGMYKKWQWSTVIDNKHVNQIKDYIKSNWSERPYIKPVRKSIILGTKNTHHVLALTNNT